MEMQTEENVNFMENSDDKEYLQRSLCDEFDQSNFVIHPKENETGQEESQIVELNEKSFMELQTPLLEESQVALEENETTVQSELEELPLYQLNNIDTESSIKTEIKELILSRISEEVDVTIFNDMTDDLEDQTSTLKTLITNQQNKNDELKNALESDVIRLTQSEQMLLRANDITALLKSSVEKTASHYTESKMDEFLKKSLKQQEDWILLKKTFITNLESAKARLKNEEKQGNEVTIILQKQLAEKEQVLNTLKNAEDELKKSISVSENDIKMMLSKRTRLEKMLEAQTDRKLTLEKELQERTDLFQELCITLDKEKTRLDSIEKSKTETDEVSEKIKLELEQIKNNLASTEEEILIKRKEMETLQTTIELENKKCQESLEKVQQEYNNITMELKEAETQRATYRTNIEHLSIELNKLKSDYIKSCEKQLQLVDTTTEQEKQIHQLNMTLLRKQMINDSQKSKYEELQKHYDALNITLNSLDKEITEQREHMFTELMQAKLQLNVAQENHDKVCSELHRKKEYLLENSSFLEEKCKNLETEVSKLKISADRTQEENATTELIISKKLKELNELESKLNTLKNDPSTNIRESPVAPLPKTEYTNKKVKFNEVICFKSPTSSEASLKPSESVSKLETSFLQSWFGGEGSSSNNLEQIDEEL